MDKEGFLGYGCLGFGFQAGCSRAAADISGGF